VRFCWDESKDRTNRRKHHVSFEVAARVFLDPRRIEIYDDRHSEDRWIVIGAVDPALLVVVYTVRGEENAVIRLISARRANAQETTAYRERRA
jgi:hypothetical protein